MYNYTFDSDNYLVRYEGWSNIFEHTMSIYIKYSTRFGAEAFAATRKDYDNFDPIAYVVPTEGFCPEDPPYSKKEEWRVDVEFKDLDLAASEVNTAEIIRSVHDMSGISVTKFRIEVNSDSDGKINGVTIYFYDEISAKDVMGVINGCLSPNSNIQCGEILSHVATVTISKTDLFANEGYNIHGKSNVIAMLLMVAMIFLL